LRRTASRIAKAAKMGFAGGNGYRTSIRNWKYLKSHPTYQSHSLSKRRTCRKRVEDMDCSLDGFHDFAVISSELGEGPSLLLENVHDRFERMALLELPSERVVDQFRACLFLIAL
jgi:hypothetical protein